MKFPRYPIHRSSAPGVTQPFRQAVRHRRIGRLVLPSCGGVVPDIGCIRHEVILCENKLNVLEECARLTAPEDVGRYDRCGVLAQRSHDPKVDLSARWANAPTVI